MIPTSQAFQDQLDQLFESATKEGLSHIDITSGYLHRQVWGYYGRNHRMPICCYVLKKNMKHDDSIIEQPENDQGATLTIRYKLPR